MPESENKQDAPKDFKEAKEQIEVRLSIFGTGLAKGEDYVFTKYANEPLTDAEYKETIDSVNVAINYYTPKVLSKYAPILNIGSVLAEHTIKRMHFSAKENNEQTSSGSSQAGKPLILQNGKIVGRLE